MKTKLDRWDLVSLLLIAGAVGVTLALWPSLPERFPIHFDLSGRPNGWGSKAYGPWLLPGGAVVLWLILRPGSAILPAAWRERAEASPLSGLALAAVALLLSSQALCLYVATSHRAVGGAALDGALGAFSVVAGQFMPRLRRNPWAGVRTAWTLSSDENWLRTHRFAGYAMTIGGIATVLLGLLSRVAGLAAFLAGAVVAPWLYSFLLARRLPAS